MGMDVQDKERLGIGIAVALILHIGIFVGLSAHDWGSETPEYTGPVFVELESNFEPLPDPPEPEPAPEPEPELDLSEAASQLEDPAAPAAEQAPAPAAEQAPAPAAEQAPAPVTPPAQTQPQAQRAPAPTPRPTPAPVDPLAQAPTRSLAEIDAEIRGEQPDRAPERARPERDFAPGDVLPDDSPGELPEWVRSIEERGISTAEIDSRDVQQVAERIERDPEFEATLRRVIAGVEAAAHERSSAPGAGDSTAGEAGGDPGADGILGDPGTADGSAAITGLRHGRGTPNMEFAFTSQELSALPPTVTIVVAFDVLPSGQVGSLMFVRRSGYTPVDQKVADRIRRWSFSRIAGTQTETGYFTLVISREDVTR